MPNQLKRDPTRTTLLRRQFMADMRRRFAKIRRAVKKLMLEDDAFGLKIEKPLRLLEAYQAWRFKSDSQKITSFHKWLQQQVDAELLGTDVAGRPWAATYIDSAYKRGMVRGYTDAHAAELAQRPAFYEESKTQFLRDAFTQGEALSKVELLYTRTFEELRGVTAAMGQQMSRVLANGLAHGVGPREIARDLDKTITSLTRTRALVIARTEIVAAHAEGQLDSFERLGITEVQGVAEWSTAGDDRVCELCAPLEGTTYTLEEARGLIPLHPNCRCAWIPTSKRKAAEAGMTPEEFEKYKEKMRAKYGGGIERKPITPPVTPKVTPKVMPRKVVPRKVVEPRKAVPRKVVEPRKVVPRKVVEPRRVVERVEKEVVGKGVTRFRTAEEYRQHIIASVEKGKAAAKTSAEVMAKTSRMEVLNKQIVEIEAKRAAARAVGDKELLHSLYQKMAPFQKEAQQLSKEISAAKKVHTMQVKDMRKLLFEDNNMKGLFNKTVAFDEKWKNVADDILSMMPKDRFDDTTIAAIRNLRVMDIGGSAGSSANAAGYIKMAGSAKASTFAHEFGHHLSYHIRRFMREQTMFFNARTVGEKSKALAGYTKELFGKIDKFSRYNSYAGRIYGDGHTPEVASVGLEYIFKNPYTAAKKDPEWFNMVIKCIKGLEA